MKTPRLLPLLLLLASLDLSRGENAPSASGSAPVQIVQISAPDTNGILAYTKETRDEIDLSLKNVSGKELALRYDFKIVDHDDANRFRGQGDLVLPAGAVQTLPLKFEAKEWLLGPYEAEVSFFADSSTAPFLTQTLRLGLVSSTPIEKARPGEFLYGLDPANNGIYPTHTPLAFAYYRLMGVDILRNLVEKGASWDSVDYIGQALRELGAEGVQGGLMCDPPREVDPAKQAQALGKKTAFLEALAQRYSGQGPGKLHFYELGNEPDLHHFYPRPMKDYVECYQAMRDAIKKGAAEGGFADSDTTVTNGGLSLAGKEGGERTREFFGLVDIGKLDAIAYHGHGPAIEAERSAYERVHAAAAEAGKAVRPFVETESGFSGVGREGLRLQARTVVEKMTYAQAEGVPLFYFFRLFMEKSANPVEGGYGMTTDFTQPHPAVLSYRNLVERLRHFRFAKTLDFDGKAGTEGVDAYLFEERDASGTATGRKTVVAFSERPKKYNLRLRLDASSAAVRDASLVDLFGNAVPAETADGKATLPVGLDPVYLAWSSPGGADAVQIAPPVISIPSVESLPAGTPSQITLTLNDPLEQPVEAEVSIAPHGLVSPGIERVPRKVTLQPQVPLPFSFSVRTDGSSYPLSLPLWWKIYPDVDATTFSPDQLAQLPGELAGTNGPVPGRYVLASDRRLDFAKIAGVPREKRPGVAYAVLDSPRACTLDCGASGDWWMAWYVNGQKACDTLATGNGQHGNIALHRFSLPLKQGRNVLCVVLLSGSWGWSVDFGGPQELQTALNTPDALTVSLKAGGKTLALQEVPFFVRPPVPRLPAETSLDTLADWMTLEPLAVLDAASVTNLWMKEPDSSKWYVGPKDLSATAWLRDDGMRLHLFVAVTDDHLVAAQTPGDLPQCDSLRIVAADDAGKPLFDTTAGLVGSAPAAIGAPSGFVCDVSRRETPGADAQTLYHASFPRTLVREGAFRLNFAVADNDAGYLKQVLRFGNVDAPAQGEREVLAHP